MHVYIQRHACIYMHVLVNTMYIHDIYVYVPFCQIMSMWSGFQMHRMVAFSNSVLNTSRNVPVQISFNRRASAVKMPLENRYSCE